MRGRIQTYLIVALLLATVTSEAMARKRVVRADTKALAKQTSMAHVPDSLMISGEEALESVRLYGYDKPHSSSRESLFMESKLPTDTIVTVTLSIQYQAMNGQGLHKRDVTLPCHLAPGESERLQFPSWDKTQTFYYFRNEPKRATGKTPYKVTVIPKAIGISRANTDK